MSLQSADPPRICSSLSLSFFDASPVGEQVATFLIVGSIGWSWTRCKGGWIDVARVLGGRHCGSTQVWCDHVSTPPLHLAVSLPMACILCEDEELCGGQYDSAQYGGEYYFSSNIFHRAIQSSMAQVPPSLPVYHIPVGAPMVSISIRLVIVWNGPLTLHLVASIQAITPDGWPFLTSYSGFGASQSLSCEDMWLYLLPEVLGYECRMLHHDTSVAPSIMVQAGGAAVEIIVSVCVALSGSTRDGGMWVTISTCGCPFMHMPSSPCRLDHSSFQCGLFVFQGLVDAASAEHQFDSGIMFGLLNATMVDTFSFCRGVRIPCPSFDSMVVSSRDHSPVATLRVTTFSRVRLVDTLLRVLVNSLASGIEYAWPTIMFGIVLERSPPRYRQVPTQVCYILAPMTTATTPLAFRFHVLPHCQDISTFFDSRVCRKLTHLVGSVAAMASIPICHEVTVLVSCSTHDLNYIALMVPNNTMRILVLSVVASTSIIRWTLLMSLDHGVFARMVLPHALFSWMLDGITGLVHYGGFDVIAYDRLCKSGRSICPLGFVSQYGGVQQPSVMSSIAHRFIMGSSNAETDNSLLVVGIISACAISSRTHTRFDEVEWNSVVATSPSLRHDELDFQNSSWSSFSAVTNDIESLTAEIFDSVDVILWDSASSADVCCTFEPGLFLVSASECRPLQSSLFLALTGRSLASHSGFTSSPWYYFESSQGRLLIKWWYRKSMLLFPLLSTIMAYVYGCGILVVRPRKGLILQASSPVRHWGIVMLSDIATCILKAASSDQINEDLVDVTVAEEYARELATRTNAVHVVYVEVAPSSSMNEAPVTRRNSVLAMPTTHAPVFSIKSLDLARSMVVVSFLVNRGISMSYGFNAVTCVWLCKSGRSICSLGFGFQYLLTYPNRNQASNIVLPAPCCYLVLSHERSLTCLLVTRVQFPMTRSQIMTSTNCVCSSRYLVLRCVTMSTSWYYASSWLAFFCRWLQSCQAAVSPCYWSMVSCFGAVLVSASHYSEPSLVYDNVCRMSLPSAFGAVGGSTCRLAVGPIQDFTSTYWEMVTKYVPSAPDSRVWEYDHFQLLTRLWDHCCHDRCVSDMVYCRGNWIIQHGYHSFLVGCCGLFELDGISSILNLLWFDWCPSLHIVITVRVMILSELLASTTDAMELVATASLISSAEFLWVNVLLLDLLESKGALRTYATIIPSAEGLWLSSIGTHILGVSSSAMELRCAYFVTARALSGDVVSLQHCLLGLRRFITSRRLLLVSIRQVNVTCQRFSSSRLYLSNQLVRFMWYYMEACSVFVISACWVLVTCAHGWLLIASFVSAASCRSSPRSHCCYTNVVPPCWSVKLVLRCLLSSLHHGRWYSRIGSAEDSILVVSLSLSREPVWIVSYGTLVALPVLRCSKWVEYLSLSISWLCQGSSMSWTTHMMPSWYFATSLVDLICQWFRWFCTDVHLWWWLAQASTAGFNCTSCQSKLVCDLTCRLWLLPGAIFTSTWLHVLQSSRDFTSVGQNLLVTSTSYAFYPKVWMCPLLLLSALWILSCCWDHIVANVVTQAGYGVLLIGSCGLTRWLFGCLITLVDVIAVCFLSVHASYACDFDAMDSLAVSMISPSIMVVVWTEILVQFTTSNVSHLISWLTSISNDMVNGSTFAVELKSDNSCMMSHQQNGAIASDVVGFPWPSVRFSIGNAGVNTIETEDYWRFLISNERTGLIDDVVELVLPRYSGCLVYWALPDETPLASIVDSSVWSLPIYSGWIDMVFSKEHYINRPLTRCNEWTERVLLRRSEWFDRIDSIFDSFLLSYYERIVLNIMLVKLVLQKCNEWISTMIEIIVDTMSSWTSWFCKSSLLTWISHLMHGCDRMVVG